MMDGHSADAIAAFNAELTRLGLDSKDLAGLVLSSSLDQLVERLRALKPGATWSDVFPGMPESFVPGQWDTWPQKYVPEGAYDYQELPTGPAIHIAWNKALGNSPLDAFVASARDAGWPIYGAGLLPMTADPQWPTADALVILTRGTGSSTLHEFAAWIGRRTDVNVAAIVRDGSEKYTGR